MPALSGEFDWNPGLIWQVGFIDGKVQLATEDANGNLHICPALVDTGASATCISKSVAEALGLRPIGKAPMQTAGGPMSANIYDVHVGIWSGEKRNSDGTVTRQFEFIFNIQALEFEAGDSSFQALIGRDILRRGVLNLSFDGHFSFAF